jgi:hypothetical protein
MWTLQLLAAPGDGVAPAVLVTVGDERRGGQVRGRRGEEGGHTEPTTCPRFFGVSPHSLPPPHSQYLLNTPEGYARLALEHHARPTGRLRAALVTSLAARGVVSKERGERDDDRRGHASHTHTRSHLLPPSLFPSQSGLAGLLMRLRSDGHGELRVVGPPGVAAVAGGLRHLVSWRHPTVFVDEAEAEGEAAVYEDDLVEVRGAWTGGGGWRGFEPAANTPPSSSPSSSPSSPSSSPSSLPTGGGWPPGARARAGGGGGMWMDG